MTLDIGRFGTGAVGQEHASRVMRQEIQRDVDRHGGATT
jgi:hypothetical protein